MTGQPLRDQWGNELTYLTPQYLLIMRSVDGDDPNRWLTAEELRDVLADPEHWAGIEQFMPGVPKIAKSTYAQENGGWPERAALLLEVRVVQPGPGEAPL